MYLHTVPDVNWRYRYIIPLQYITSLIADKDFPILIFFKTQRVDAIWQFSVSYCSVNMGYGVDHLTILLVRILATLLRHYEKR